MMATRNALARACRITLFTRVNCSLCTSAREVLQRVNQKRPFEFHQIDVMEPQNSKWKIYEFDVPVVSCTFSLCSFTKSRLIVSQDTCRILEPGDGQKAW